MCLLVTKFFILLSLKSIGILAFIYAMKDRIPKCLCSSSGRMPVLIKSIKTHFKDMANENISFQTCRPISVFGISFQLKCTKMLLGRRNTALQHVLIIQYSC